jgi:hypothetical protein
VLGGGAARHGLWSPEATLATMHPGFHLLVMSGEYGSALVAAANHLGIACCLPKPIAVNDLRARVAELLRSRPGARPA